MRQKRGFKKRGGKRQTGINKTKTKSQAGGNALKQSCLATRKRPEERGKQAEKFKPSSGFLIKGPPSYQLEAEGSKHHYQGLDPYYPASKKRAPGKLVFRQASPYGEGERHCCCRAKKGKGWRLLVRMI